MLIDMASPTVRRLQLGRGLAAQRTAAHPRITQKQAAAIIECSQTKIAQIEKGKAPITRAELIVLLQEYGADQATIEQFDQIRLDAGERGWWHVYDLPDWISDYIGLEQAATTARAFEQVLIPGLLQAEAYAREVHVLRGALTVGQIDTRVAARIQRQARLSATVNPLHLTAVVTSYVLQLCTERPDAIAVAQLRHLYDLAQLPNVTLQILPSERGRHPCMQGSFTVLSFPDDVLDDVAVLENALAGHTVDDGPEVSSLIRLHSQIRDQALGDDESLATLADLLRTLQ